MTEKFELNFIKFYHEIQKKYNLSPTETLIYWYITEVIEFQRRCGNTPVCFTLSSTIAQNVNCKPQTVNNAIKKLKDKWLIETRNSFVKETKRKYRHIYIPWEAPINRNDKVSQFFKTCSVVKDNERTRAIVGNWIYHHQKSGEWIMKKLYEFFWHQNEQLDEWDLREIYSELTTETGFQESIERKKEAFNKKNKCELCWEEYHPLSGECYCDLPF